MANAPTLTLLGRAGCHLCDAMRMELVSHLARAGWVLEEIDITGKPDLESRYGWDIPVLLADGQEICRHFFDESAWNSWQHAWRQEWLSTVKAEIR